MVWSSSIALGISHLVYLFTLECTINFRQWERIAACGLLPFIPKPTRNLRKESHCCNIFNRKGPTILLVINRVHRMILICIFPAESISRAKHDKYVEIWLKYFSMQDASSYHIVITGHS